MGRLDTRLDTEPLRGCRAGRSALAGVTGGLALLVVACTGSPSGGDASGGGSSPSPQAQLAIEPADGTDNVAPDKPIVVNATKGSIRKVTVKTGSAGTPSPSAEDDGGDAEGEDEGEPSEVEGKLSADARSWKSQTSLVPDTTYTVRATAVDANGLTSVERASFTTLEPDKALRAAVAPLDGETVGVGMPIVVYPSEPVAEEYRDEVERRLQVSTSETSEPVEGAWHWMDGEEVHFRPREYWPAGTHVTLRTRLAGVHAGEGMWGNRNRTIEFDVGERHVSVVNADGHRMRVKRGGETVKTFPISAGDSEHPSSSGTHVALEKTGDMTMDSSSYGVPVDSPEGYSVETKYNVRYTWSGQFVHSAPWSVGSQGSSNVSHGCVNMAPGNAKWFYQFSQRGDIIKVKGTSKDVESRNGWTDWNVSWDEWVDGSALDRSVKTSA